MRKNDSVKLLQELVEVQRKLIAELEKRPIYTQSWGTYPQPQIFIPSMWQVRCMPGSCVYDPLGTAGGLRHCKQCGQQEVPYTTVTVTSGVTTEPVPTMPSCAVLTTRELPKTNGQFFVGISPSTISRP